MVTSDLRGVHAEEIVVVVFLFSVFRVLSERADSKFLSSSQSCSNPLYS